MFPIVRWQALTLALALAVAGVARAAEQLPDGAFLRLGTTAFRHQDLVLAAAYTPDGKVLVTAGADGCVRLWDPVSGKELHCFGPWREGRFGGLNCFAMSRDGRRVAVQCSFPHSVDDSIILLDLNNRKVLRTIKATSYSTAWLAFSPDGKRIARWGDGMVWDADSGKLLRDSNRTGGSGYGLAVSPDGKTLLKKVTDQDEEFVLWDLVNDRKLRPLPVPDRHLSNVTFAPDGKTLATAGEDRDIRLWDVKTAKERWHVRLKGKDKSPYSLAFTRDGKTLACGAAGDAPIVLLGTADGSEVRRLGTGEGTSHVVFSPDGETLVSWGGYQLQTVRRWDVDSGKEIDPGTSLAAQVAGLSFAPGGKLLAVASRDGVIRLWDVSTGREVRRLQAPGALHGLFYLAFSPDGKTLAGAPDKTICRWDVATGRALPSLVGHKYFPPIRLAFSPDGKTLASVDSLFWYRPRDGITSVCQWDLQTGKLLHQHEIAALSPGVYAQGPQLCLSPDGSRLAAGEGLGGHERIRLWVLPGLRPVAPLKLKNSRMTGGFFTADGRGFVACQHSEPSILWELATARVRRELPPGNPMRISPDGRTLLLDPGREGNLFLYDLATDRELCRLKRKPNTWPLAEFSGDGRLLAVSQPDATVLVWRLADLMPKGAEAALPEKDLIALWNELAEGDAERGGRAVWRLAAHPTQAVALLAARLKPFEARDWKATKKLLADLDDDDFDVREAASKKLARLGADVRPALEAVLADTPSVEVRRRIADLLAGMRESTGDSLRHTRALEVLEMIGTPEARRVLEALAKGHAWAALTVDARASLLRLARR